MVQKWQNFMLPLCIASVLIISKEAKAENNGVLSHYVTLGFAIITQKPDSDLRHSDWGRTDLGFNNGKSFDVQDLVVKIGGQISENFHGELRLGKTISSKEVDGVKYGYNYHLIPTLHYSRVFYGFEPYIFLGYGFGKRSLSGVSRRGSSDLSSPTYGAGMNYNITSKLGVNFEYSDLYPAENIAPKMWNAGIFIRF